MTVPCFSFVGRSGIGKTTLLERVVALLTQRGYRVAVLKHTRHTDIETDAPGTDTRRFWDVGAVETLLVTPERVVRTRRVHAPAPAEIAATVQDVDVVLVEGDKYGPLPKIEVLRAACTTTLLPDIVGRVAVITDIPNSAWEWPTFALDNVAGLADFIEARIAAAALARVGNWEEREHTADLALRVTAPDLPALFAAAGRGMFSLITDITTIPLTRTTAISLQALDRESLLVDWLNELLYLSEEGVWAYVAFCFDVLTETTLQATAFGGPAPKRLNYVKAATFHDLTIRAGDFGFETQVVFDT